MFVIQRDFDRLLNSRDIAVLLEETDIYSETILLESIDFAVEYVKSKIQQRYDPDEIFIDVTEYDNSVTYAVNDQVLWLEDRKYYYAIQAGTGNLPSDTAYWTAGDLRNSLIRDYVIKISLKELFLRVQPRVIPEWVISEFERAETHLTRISSGKDTVLLPVRTDADGDEIGHNTVYGSETQKDWNF